MSLAKVDQPPSSPDDTCSDGKNSSRSRSHPSTPGRGGVVCRNGVQQEEKDAIIPIRGTMT
eukprot:GSA120T00017869001.1